jgi:hypothetical protein
MTRIDLVNNLDYLCMWPEDSNYAQKLRAQILEGFDSMYTVYEKAREWSSLKNISNLSPDMVAFYTKSYTEACYALLEAVIEREDAEMKELLK